MRTHRFGRKIKPPATITIKHQVRMRLLNMRSKRQKLKQGLKEDKMEWISALIVLMIVPFWIVLWWIPHCDAIGIQKAKVN